jgi:hypothetical protein
MRSVSSVKPRAVFGVGGPKRLLVAGTVIASMLCPVSLQATELVRDDFEDGVIDDTLYSVIGSAVMVEVGGKLQVTVFKQGDGVRIEAPRGATSFIIDQQITLEQFDIGEAINFKALIPDPDTGKEYPLLASRMLRPFWNFCVYDVSQGGGNSSTIGIFCGRGYTTEDSCPDAKDLRLDWLPPLPGETQDRIVYQVRDKDGTWRFGKSRPSDAVHANGDLTGYTITFSHIDPNFCLE